MKRPERIRLGNLLVQEFLITPDQLSKAIAEQKLSGLKLGRVITDNGWVDEVQIAKALARQLNVPFVDLTKFTVRPEVVQLLPELQARRLRAIPLEETANGVRVGVVDPSDLNVYDEIVRLLRRDVELAVLVESQLLMAIDKSYRSREDIAGLAKALTTELTGADRDLGDLLGLDNVSVEDAPVARLLYSVFEQALQVRASDIHIEPQERSLRIRYRIDGLLHVQAEADSKIAGAVALRLKLMSGLDISEKRLPQDGRFSARLRSGAVDVRISTMPTQYGESVAMRLLNQHQGGLSLSALNLPLDVSEALHRALARPSGMVLVTGPTGSGKTTTLYAALTELNTTDRKIITVEEPVEYRLPGLTQVQVMDKIDLSFDRVLRAALRQDPDIIMVGEMRDGTTAEIGLRAALTGHLVLSTLHTNDAISTPIRLLDMGIPKYMVAIALQLVLAQRLVRVVCPHCAEVHVPAPHELVWLRGIVDAAVLEGAQYRLGRGCAACHQTGYIARTGVYEFIEMTQELVDALNHADPGHFAQAARRQMKGRTLARDALRLVIEGRTTVSDAMRISNQMAEA